MKKLLLLWLFSGSLNGFSQVSKTTIIGHCIAFSPFVMLVAIYFVLKNEERRAKQ